MASLNVHAMVARSRANGPGVRRVIWLQGCRLNCPGCFNPETHSHQPREVWQVEELVRLIEHEQEAIEGITLSGGEPMEQATGVLELVRHIRAVTRLSIILFSGYTRQEIEEQPHGSEILRQVDVLIAGRYDPSQHLARGLRGSANQEVHFITNRYAPNDLESVPSAEVLITADGSVILSGIGICDCRFTFPRRGTG